MLTFEDMYELAQTMTNDTSTGALTYLKQNINIGLHFVEDALGSFYSQETATDSTTASTSTYQTPARFVRFNEVYITVSSVRYPIEQIYDERLWQTIKSRSSSQTSDIPQFMFTRKDTYEVYPTPATSSNTITMIYEASNKDLTAADYTGGTITTLANASKAVTGSSTDWVTQGVIAGRWFKINADGVWYKIATVGSATSITLQKNFEGTAISAGTSAYTIGEIPNIPPSTHMLPVYYAVGQYYAGIKVDGDKSSEYMDMFFGRSKYKGSGLDAAKERWGHRYTSRVIRSQRRYRKGIGVINPNFYPTVIT